MKIFKAFKISVVVLFLFNFLSLAAQDTIHFSWPEGYRMALSLTFDDGRNSQVDIGTPLFDKYDVKATFLVVPGSVEQRLSGWKKAVDSGHEIGNHSTFHPCSGNFLWSRKNALEDYSLEKMHQELLFTNQKIYQLLGVTPEVFAYPCGQKFVGRGVNTKSYVPVIAQLFILGRGWLDEGPNDPAFCDMAQLTGMEMDGKDFEEILSLINQVKESGQWLVLAGHEIGAEGRQTTRTAMLEKLIQYALNPENGIWLAPAGTIAKYINEVNARGQ
jgi:peptidoglycan/xylan/chitin deacetylase (PgdA/CDA1 family)